MQLLCKVKGDVLWLRGSNLLFDKNIIKAAKKRNMCALRTVFNNLRISSLRLNQVRNKCLIII